MAADVELMALRAVEADLTARLGDLSLGATAGGGDDAAAPNGTSNAAAGGGSGQAATPPQADGQSPDGGDFDADAAGARLNEVYERMNEIGGHTAEARASKILYGLGERLSQLPCRREEQSSH